MRETPCCLKVKGAHSLVLETGLEHLHCLNEETDINKMLKGDREGKVLPKEIDLGGPTLGAPG